MSQIVNIIPNIETRQSKQVNPTIQQYAKDLQLTEMSSFNTNYLKSLKRELNISIMFNEMINEAVTGKEEHNESSADSLITALSNYFGIMSSSRTDVNTGDVSIIPDPNPPVYTGAASTLISVVEDSFDTTAPIYHRVPDVITSYEAGSDPGTTILHTENATYVPWNEVNIRTDVTGDTEIPAVKVGATSFKIEAVIDTDDILGQTILMYGGEKNVDQPMVVIIWETQDNFTGYVLRRNGETIATIIEGSTSTYEDRAVVEGVNYSYTIASIDEEFGELSQSAPKAITIAQSLYLPTTLVAEYLEDGVVGDAHAYLQWEPMEGVSSYRVYKDGSSVTIIPKNVTTYRDRNIFPGASHSYTIITSYEDGYSSEFSNAAVVDIPDSVSAGINIPRLDSVELVGDGSKLKLVWGSNGNSTSVLHDIYLDRVITENVIGSRDVASDTVWTETYEFTPENFDPRSVHFVMVRARDSVTGKESEWSQQIKLNEISASNELHIYADGKWTDSITELQLPANYIIDMATEYIGDNTDVKTVQITITGMSMNVEEYSYTRTVSAANNYRFEEPLHVSYYTPTSTPRIAINVAYFGQFGQIIVARTVILNITAPPETIPAGIKLKTPLDPEDTYIQAWGTYVEDINLFTKIGIGDFSSIVKQEYNNVDYKFVSLATKYTGDPVAANTDVTILRDYFPMKLDAEVNNGDTFFYIWELQANANILESISSVVFENDNTETEYDVVNILDTGFKNPYDRYYSRFKITFAPGNSYSGFATLPIYSGVRSNLHVTPQ